MSSGTFAPTFAPFRRRVAAKVGRNGGLSHLSPPFRRTSSGAKVLKENKVFLLKYIYVPLHTPPCPRNRVSARARPFSHARGSQGAKGVKVPKFILHHVSQKKRGQHEPRQRPRPRLPDMPAS